MLDFYGWGYLPLRFVFNYLHSVQLVWRKITTYYIIAPYSLWCRESNLFLNICVLHEIILLVCAQHGSKGKIQTQRTQRDSTYHFNVVKSGVRQSTNAVYKRNSFFEMLTHIADTSISILRLWTTSSKHLDRQIHKKVSPRSSFQTMFIYSEIKGL